MSHQQTSFVTKCVKYLNVVLGILMLVLACLNLESILHSSTHEQADFEADKQTYWNHLGILQEERTARLFIEKCDHCHTAAIKAIVSFNSRFQLLFLIWPFHLINKIEVKGFVLSLVLSALSFLLAFELNSFHRYYAVSVPVSANFTIRFSRNFCEFLYSLI